MTNKRVIEILEREKCELLEKEVKDWEHITALSMAVQALEFAEFTGKMLFDDWEQDCNGVFPELACRRLVELSVVDYKDGVYSLKGGRQ